MFAAIGIPDHLIQTKLYRFAERADAGLRPSYLADKMSFTYLPGTVHIPEAPIWPRRQR